MKPQTWLVSYHAEEWIVFPDKGPKASGNNFDVNRLIFEEPLRFFASFTPRKSLVARHRTPNHLAGPQLVQVLIRIYLIHAIDPDDVDEKTLEEFRI